MSRAPLAPGPLDVLLRVQRRDGRDAPPRFDDFRVKVPRWATVHRALVEVQLSPITVDGRRVDPPAWDASCLEGSCGSCTMRIAGRARLACSTRVEDVAPRRGPLVLEPLARFPNLRDLVVDRSRQDAALARTDRPAALAPSSREDDPTATAAGALERGLLDCIACGACVEACPETGLDQRFVGPEAIARNRLQVLHAGADDAAREALDRRLMEPGGIADCGKAQACSEACPADVPLIEALSHAARATSRRFLLGWMRR